MSPAASQPRRRGPRSDAQRNDQHILETAARILAEDPRATIQRIADEAGVVRVTVYRRFRNREALRRAIFDTAAAETHRAITDAVDRDLDPVAALRALIVEMAAIIQRYPVLSVSTDWQPAPGDTHRPVPPPPARRMHQAVFALVERGQKEGLLRDDLPPELLPQAITGTLHIVTRFARSLRADPDSIGGHVAELLLNGFTAPAAIRQ
ncbi:MAG TPA: TetR/AcrR family transcriptional regulator [Stackebrandtia sp.]|jgi:AcrR family transcriptional regulator|uniref:TetR/AcrR family transcriptional regulator n=1 Tax=Stackebrandtia sp. TaxID=2023065 RepID=UPI002D2EF61D|nr:TetR/AcrR family transcriptional regulator [Stackebrandtia sp.]HZE39351.1 TetR/AcrR family transcriptional regulator [Stackebrandtia sp.]